MFIEALFIMSPSWRRTKMSISNRTNKLWYIFITGYHIAMKMNDSYMQQCGFIS